MYLWYTRALKRCEDNYSNVKHRNELFDVFIFVIKSNSFGITRALHAVGTVPVFDLSN